MEHIGAGPIVIRLAEDVAWIFSRAIKFGCLVRGGIAFAPLRHKDGVVFGRGLVEAHELELKFAGRPRIIVSAGAAEKLGPNPYFYSDDDGFSCLNYVRAAYDLEMQQKRDRRESALNWIADVKTHCENQVSALHLTNLPGFGNWRWFLTRFERFVASDLGPLI